MNPQHVTLARVILSWDSSGRIKHDIITNLKFDQYKKDDCLGYSAVVSFESQLGVIAVHRSIALCDKVLNFVERNEILYEPINSALKGVEIEIIRGNNIIHQFYPRIGTFSNNDSVEDGICQFLGNYLTYTYKITSSEGVPLRIKYWSLYAIQLFLNGILFPLVSKGIVHNVNKNYWEIQSKTIEDTVTLYESWDNYQTLDQQMDKINKNIPGQIQLCRTRLIEITHALGLSY